MDFSAHLSFFRSRIATLLFFILGLLLLSSFSPIKTHAQVPNSIPSFAKPNVESGVPQNQHTLVQSVTIEVINSFICQLSGIDPIDPQHGCLGVNGTTKKLGYSSTNGQYKLGGVLGFGTSMIASLYIPPASGVSYMKNLAGNFGIVKKGYAQAPCGITDKGPGCPPATGFDALKPIQSLWSASRNLTYTFFVIVFVLIGMGIMLRVKLEAKTVMTIQNQIPKIVVALVLITFSYAIVGLMIDFMWVTTYFGINVLTSANNPTVVTCGDVPQSDASKAVFGDRPPLDSGPKTLKERAFNNILNFPLAFVNDIFHQTHCTTSYIFDSLAGSSKPGDIVNSGIANLSYQVGTAIGSVIADTVTAVLPFDKSDCGIRHFSGCVEYAIGKVIDFVISSIGILIALIAIVIAMFRLWWSLLKAYAYVIIYTIIGPFWILLGLQPGGSIGFSRWFRTILANLAIFPASAFLIITARIILDVYTDTSNNYFITPLTGNPSIGVMGPLLAFGLLLIAPELLNLIREGLKAPTGKIGGIVQGGIGAGAGPVGGMLGYQVGRLTAAGNEHAGIPAGPVRQWALGTGAKQNGFQRAFGAISGARLMNPHPVEYPKRGPLGGGDGGH